MKNSISLFGKVDFDQQLILQHFLAMFVLEHFFLMDLKVEQLLAPPTNPSIIYEAELLEVKM